MVQVLAVGEVLWDVVGDKRFLGGAPFNFAYGCSALKLSTRIATRVGQDPLGTEVVDRANSLNLSTELIQVDPDQSTGVATVELSGTGIPTFDIRQPAAWDYIELTDPLERIAAQVDLLYFGTLAQRDRVSRETIQHLLKVAAPDTFRFCDLNLRRPYVSNEVIHMSLTAANMLKLNEDELQHLRELYSLPITIEDAAATLAEMYDLQAVLITRGADGALAWTHDHIASVPGIHVDIVDTIGSGDAFAAGFVSHILKGGDIEAALQFANAAGAYVASQPGATPPLTTEHVRQVLLKSPTLFDK